MQNEKRREKGERKQESLDADQTSQTPRILRLRRLPTRWKLVKPVSSLFSGSSTSIYYTSTCSRCSTLEEGERAKLEFSLRALLRRIDRELWIRLDPPPWVRLYFKYLYALASRQWTLPPETEDAVLVVQRG
ncbi:hypothetical protein HZH66_007703 [Vespula vulgaris]|uniref:Uncharacterized protein n=1 Tax=Vespula vulgaris TaxID=7454 RepID=A0A834JX37_VESVU|nr:hypothetical protein HZH66_007703 [Vespula vulgaris]